MIDPGLEPKRFEFIDKVINSIPRKGATKYWAWVAGIRFGLLDGQYRIIDDVARTTRFPATNVKHILGNFNTHMRLFENGALSQYLPGLRLVP